MVAHPAENEAANIFFRTSTKDFLKADFDGLFSKSQSVCFFLRAHTVEHMTRDRVYQMLRVPREENQKTLVILFKFLFFILEVKATVFSIVLQTNPLVKLRPVPRLEACCGIFEECWQSKKSLSSADGLQEVAWQAKMQKAFGTGPEGLWD